MSMRRIGVAAGLAAGAAAVGFVLCSQTADTQEPPWPTEVRVIEVRNDCPRPVWLWYGRGEPLRPEDAVKLAGRSSSFESMLEGDVVWLLDDTRRGLDSARLSATTARIVIDDSCRSIGATHTASRSEESAPAP
jgi:hypothetical protein